MFMGGCALAYFGVTMLLFVPVYRGDSYLKTLFLVRVLYGIIPAACGVALLVTVGWLWDRSNGSRDLSKAINRSLSFGVGAILLFWLVVILLRRNST